MRPVDAIFIYKIMNIAHSLGSYLDISKRGKFNPIIPIICHTNGYYCFNVYIWNIWMTFIILVAGIELFWFSFEKYFFHEITLQIKTEEVYGNGWWRNDENVKETGYKMYKSNSQCFG
jgi:hypothetical protein